jgi:hypothetical protein
MAKILTMPERIKPVLIAELRRDCRTSLQLTEELKRLEQIRKKTEASLRRVSKRIDSAFTRIGEGAELLQSDLAPTKSKAE